MSPSATALLVILIIVAVATLLGVRAGANTEQGCNGNNYKNDQEGGRAGTHSPGSADCGAVSSRAPSLEARPRDCSILAAIPRHTLVSTIQQISQARLNGTPRIVGSTRSHRGTEKHMPAKGIRPTIIDLNDGGFMAMRSGFACSFTSKRGRNHKKHKRHKRIYLSCAFCASYGSFPFFNYSPSN